MDKETYLKEPAVKYLTKSEVFEAYRKADIKREYVDLIKEFINNLIQNLHTTFLGHEFINTETDIFNHFNWCFEKAVNNYKFINFNFEHKNRCFVYFFKHAQMHIYNNRDYTEDCLLFDQDYFKHALKYDNKKTIDDLSTFTEVYFTVINFII